MRYAFILTADLPDDLTAEQIDYLAGTLQVQLDEPMIGFADDASWAPTETVSENVRMDVFDGDQWDVLTGAISVGLDGASPDDTGYTAEILDETWRKVNALVNPPLFPKEDASS